MHPKVRLQQWWKLTWILAISWSSAAGRLNGADSVDFDVIQPLLAKHCLDCHSAKDPEGKLVLEDHASFLRGGESGEAILPGHANESLLVRALEGRWEKDGKLKIMPPGKRAKLDPAEIALVKQWIDAGAKAGKASKARSLVTPVVKPSVPPRASIQALASTFQAKWLAVARYGEVEIRSVDSQAPVRTLAGHHGNVNAIAFSSNGVFLASAAGQPGASGEWKLWKVATGELLRSVEGHRDAIYSIAFSPDGQWLATGSYDQDIQIWSVEDGRAVRTLHGHNGAVYDLAFRPDGRVLASASGDRTVKLWEASSGKRLDTLSQPTKEVYALAWNLTGDRLYAAGVDNRIRLWKISEQGGETTNPLLESRFAHEGTVLRLALSPDGKTLASTAEDRRVKLWDSATIAEQRSFEAQPDLAPALAFLDGGKALAVGRLDGTLTVYETANGQVKAPAKPESVRVEPRGFQRGSEARLQVSGHHFWGAVTLRCSALPEMQSKIVGVVSEDHFEAALSFPEKTPRGWYPVVVSTPAGESAPFQVWVDDISQARFDPSSTKPLSIPVTVWGALKTSGERHAISLQVEGPGVLVCELNTSDLRSKLQPRLELLDDQGLLLSSQAPARTSGDDTLLTHLIAKSGVYRLVVQDETAHGSAEHEYRLTIGMFPYVAAVFPLTVNTPGTGVQTQSVHGIGYNLPPGIEFAVPVSAGASGEVPVHWDSERLRGRKGLTVIATEYPESVEAEPNDTLAQANRLSLPGGVNGQLWNREALAGVDEDCFVFEAEAGQSWILETEASRRGSPADTLIEVLGSDGKPVLRSQLQAVRNTAINFRGVDANNTGMRLDHYEEMELNEFLYLNGDVMKLFRMPQGPDSDMVMYSKNGRRRAYFDTSATAHALDEVGYIVVPVSAQAAPLQNGLPIFPLYFRNDDDGERIMGSDSRVFFKVPKTGTYGVRVTEATRRSGERLEYRLIARAPHPDFEVSLDNPQLTVSPGSGQRFGFRVERKDGFEGAIRIEITGLPRGFAAASPVLMEAGHDSASNTLFSEKDAPEPSEADIQRVQITALADVEGRLVVAAVKPFTAIRRGEALPKILVALAPSGRPEAISQSAASPWSELVIEPGQTVPARLSVQRNGYDEVITFDVENLPHGVIVDNLGLNGITFLKGESEREIFLTAAKWVEPMQRPCFAIENQAGRQTSRPLMLRVQKPGRSGTAKAP